MTITLTTVELLTLVGHDNIVVLPNCRIIEVFRITQVSVYAHSTVEVLYSCLD